MASAEGDDWSFEATRIAEDIVDGKRFAELHDQLTVVQDAIVALQQSLDQLWREQMTLSAALKALTKPVDKS